MLTDAARSKVLDAVVQRFGQQDDLEGEQIARDVNIPERDANLLLTAFTITVALLTHTRTSAAAFIEAGRDNIFDQSSESIALSIANLIIPQRQELAKVVARQTLASSVLPSLTGFQLAVDIRVHFNNSQIDEYVSVAVANISTDISGPELILQLNRADVERMILKLQDAAKQMELAESSIRKILSTEITSE